MKRVAKALAGLFASWIVLLFVFGFILAGRTGRHVASRLGTALHAEWKLGAASLGLIRGAFYLENMSLRRNDVVGALSLDVGEVSCDLPPLGLALVDRDCRELAIEDIELDVSAVALFQIEHRKSKPFVADRVVIDNADLAFAPSAFVPGFGNVRVHVDHAEAGHTVFKTPLSWLFALEALTATFELPGGITLTLGYTPGKLSVGGSIFGSTPVELPVALPELDSAEDAKSEVMKLVKLAKDLATRLVEQRAEDWLKSKLP